MKTRVFGIVLLAVIFAAPVPLFALGEYDGVWFGVDNFSVCGESGSYDMGGVIYQESDDILWIGHIEIGIIKLIKSGGQWVLASPQDAIYDGSYITLTTMTCYFSGTNNLHGDITYTLYEDGQKYPGHTTVDYHRVESQVLSNGAELFSLSGGKDSLRCFEIDLPPGATDMRVKTWGGSGDCDLYLIFSRPDFDIYPSEGGSNWEEIFVPSPESGKWYIGLYGSDSYSGVNIKVTFNEIPIPITGDWDGDGRDEIGLYYPSESRFYLDTNNDGVLDQNVSMGRAGDLPVIGDWDGNGIDDIGVFRPSGRRFYLDTDRDGIHDISVTIGRASDVPVVGDWDQDGRDDIGVFRPSVRRYYMDFDEDGIHDRAVTIGRIGDYSLVGDWDGDGADSIGVYRPGNHRFYLDDDDDGIHDHAATLGTEGDIPVTGDWDGDGQTDVGVFRPSDNTFYLDSNLDGTADEIIDMYQIAAQYKTIIIDGNYSDWKTEDRVYLDTDGPECGNSPGQDIKEVYIAQDDGFIYLRYILNGPPDKTFGYKFGNGRRHIYVGQNYAGGYIFYGNAFGFPQPMLPDHFVHIDGNQFECKFYKSDVKEWKGKMLAAWCDQGKETVCRDYIEMPLIDLGL